MPTLRDIQNLPYGSDNEAVKEWLEKKKIANSSDAYLTLKGRVTLAYSQMRQDLSTIQVCCGVHIFYRDQVILLEDMVHDVPSFIFAGTLSL